MNLYCGRYKKLKNKVKWNKGETKVITLYDHNRRPDQEQTDTEDSNTQEGNEGSGNTWRHKWTWRHRSDGDASCAILISHKLLETVWESQSYDDTTDWPWLRLQLQYRKSVIVHYKLIIFDLYKYLIKTYRKKPRAALHAALHFPPTGFTCVWFKKDQH